MDPGAALRAVGRYGLLYGGATTAVVVGLGRSERAAAAAFVAGLVVVLLVGGLGGVRTEAGGADDPRHGRSGTALGRKLLLYGVGLAATGFAAMVVLGSVV